MAKNPDNPMQALPRERGEGSFTLLETLIAVSLLAVCLLGAVSVMGNAINVNDYDRRASQAIWLAKSVMAKIEWGSKFYDLKDLKVNVKEEKFDAALCPSEDCDFKYTAEVKEWKFDIISLLTGGLTGGGGGGDDDEGGGDEKGEDPFSGMIKEQIKAIFGDDILKVASVEVTWPEGAKQNSVSLALLLTNQIPLDNFIENLPLPKSEEEGAQEQKFKLGPDGKPLLDKNGKPIPDVPDDPNAKPKDKEAKPPKTDEEGG